jgi:phosphate transport system permease protein
MGRPKRVWVRRLVESGILTLLAGCGVFTLLITLGIIYALARDTLTFFGGVPGKFEGVSPLEFFGSLHWSPLLGADQHFGVWPLVVGTLAVTVVAVGLAGPLGLITAIWLSEYAPSRVRNLLKPILEILAGVPTVVLGFFALTVITPTLQLAFIQRPVLDANGQAMVDPAGKVMMQAWNPFGIEGYNVLAAGLAVGILTLPIVTTLAEDALRAVPRALREGSYGVGATRFETSVKVVFPAALSGIIAAILLAVARCVGETMIVALAAGGRHVPLHYIVDPPLVVETVARADASTPIGLTGDPSVKHDVRAVATVRPDAPFEFPVITVRRGEKLDEVDVSLLPASDSTSLSAQILDSTNRVLSETRVDLPSPGDADANSQRSIRLSFPAANLTGRPLRPGEEARPIGVRLESGDYRVRLTAASGAAHLAEATVEGERFMSVVDRALMPIDVRQSMQPMTGYLVQIFLGDVSNLGIEYYSSYAVAALLFVLTLILTVVGHFVRKRFQQKYE